MVRLFTKIETLFSGKNTSSYSIQGRKPGQEDALFVSDWKNNQQIIFVADGVGGHKHGEYASRLCVNIFENEFETKEKISQIPDFLKKTILLVAAKLLNKSAEDEEYKNTGTTISGFFIDKNTFFTFNVGDSRVYFFDGKKLLQATKDHSVVQNMLDKGEITEQEAFNHPKRNMMTSAIGQSLDLMKIAIKGPYKIRKNNLLLAFSDGIHDALTDAEIKKIIMKEKSIPKLARLLVESAYTAGGKDNITACLYRHR